MSTRRETDVSVPPAPVLEVAVDAIRSEFAKLASLRSSRWLFGGIALAVVGAALLLCELYVHRYSHLNLTQLSFDPIAYSLGGTLIAQLAVVVVGALAITGEHATGMIRASFAAVPQRRLVLAAKAVAVAAVTLVVSEAASFAAFLLGQAILSSRSLQVGLSSPAALRSVVGAGLYLTVLALLALAVGTIVRHSAGAIAVLFGLLLVLPGATEPLPHGWQNAINPYLPSYAGQAIFTHGEDLHLLAPWTGFGVFCLYAAVALAVALVGIERRDA